LLRTLLRFLALPCLAGCIAPLSVYPSGRSVGYQHDSTSAAMSVAPDADGDTVLIPEIRWLYGVTEDLDLGVESMIPATAGLVVRYSLINPEQDGLALALHGRLGTSPWTPASGYYAALGSTMSYREGRLEPFLAARWSISRVDLNNDNEDGFFFPDDETFDEDYMVLTLGIGWWVKKQSSLYVAAHFLNGIEGSFDELEDSFLFTLGFSSNTISANDFRF
jgi:hypothetical protein